MSLLLETIKVKQRKLQNIAYHNARLNRARKELLGLPDSWALEKIIKIPEYLDDKAYKCRVLYGEKIEAIEFHAYQIKPIYALQMVEANTIDYAYKFANRSALEALKSLATMQNAADILIVKNGLITDTSYANVVFFDGKNWKTPAKPLLKGTKRAKLLQEGVISEAEIKASDVQDFECVKIINAMIDLEESPAISTSQIWQP